MWKYMPTVWILLQAAVCVAQSGGGGMPGVPGMRGNLIPPNPHSGNGIHLPHVTEVALSRDGRVLAAAYFVDAQNCPGTDWHAWVAVWNLATGERTIIPNAMEPLAISPDGKWLAMGLATCYRKRLMPDPKPALWKMGTVEPTRKFASDVEPGAWLDWTFSADGKELMAVNDEGSLYSWKLENESPAEKLATITVPDVDHSDNEPKLTQPATLQVINNRLVIFASVRSVQRLRAVEAIWEKKKEKWFQTNLYMLRDENSTRNCIREILTSFDRMEDEILSAKLALCYIRPWRSWNNPSNLAFTKRNLKQVVASLGGGLVTVQEINGKQLAQFPAAAVHAFTPDGSQLIVSDRRGILRFWDVESGQIKRTLRLDDSPTNTFLVAAVQAPSVFGKPEENRKRLEGFIREAAYQGAQVVVLPETAVTGYMSDDLKQTWRVGNAELTPGLSGVDPKDAAETVPGPSTKFFGDLARQFGIYLTVPLLEVDRKTDLYYNTVVLLGPDGGTLIHYRKVNPWPWAEQGWASEGNLGHAVADTPFGRLGVLICFDIHKQAAELAKLKIDTLLYSVAWVDDKDSDWFPKRLPEIASAHGFNIVAANWTVEKREPEPAWHGYGQSTIIDANGEIVKDVHQRNGFGKEDPFAQGIRYAELPLPTDAAVQLPHKR